MGRKKWLVVMVVMGLMLWPVVLYAGAQSAAGASAPPGFNLQDKVTDQQLSQATGLGCEKAKVCQEGKIILWDEWGRSQPAPVNNMGNQGQVIINGPTR
jgi:hypothetical protein